MLGVVRVIHNKHEVQSIDVDYHTFNKKLTRGGSNTNARLNPGRMQNAQNRNGWEGVKIIGDRIPQLSSVE